MNIEKKVVITECDFTHSVDMFKKWTGCSSSATSILKRADDVLLPILSSRISEVFSSSSGYTDVDRNMLEIRHAGIFTATMMSYAGLLEKGALIESNVVAAAGYSLGDLGALCVAGSLPFESGLKYVVRQASIMRKMAEKIDGSFLLCTGVSDEEISQIVREIRKQEGVLEICNTKPGNGFSLSGTLSAIKRTHEILKNHDDETVKSKHAPYVGPWHCSLMEGARTHLREEIKDLELYEPRFPVISSITGKPFTMSNMKNLLEVQLSLPLNWKRSVDYLISQFGDVDWIQLSPGRLVYNDIKMGYPDFRIHLADEILSKFPSSS